MNVKIFSVDFSFYITEKCTSGVHITLIKVVYWTMIGIKLAFRHKPESK